MKNEKRKKVMLGILGALALVFVLKWLPSLFPDGPEPLPDPLAVLDSPDRSTTASRRGRRRTSRGEPSQVTEVVEVRLAALESAAREYTPGRNPFAFYVPPRPAPPPPPPPRPAPQPVVQRPPEVVVPQGPRPPEITFAYIGNFGHNTRPIAVFTNGEEIANAFVGDTVFEAFRVVEIGYESVALTYVEFPDLPAARLPVGAEGL